jgi:predicted ABC-type ATPase
MPKLMPFEIELLDIERQMIDGADQADKPVFVHMLGIPGSGKSSFLKILQAEWQKKSNATLLGFDQIMQSIPSYQAMDDKIAGFEMLEVPARLAGYRILEGLLAKRATILFDNGGSAESHPDLLRHSRDELGYRLVFVYMNTPIDVARARVDVRAVEAGQHTPLNYLEERHAKLQKLIEVYRTLTPHFYEFDNGHGDFEQMMRHSKDYVLQISKEIGF